MGKKEEGTIAGIVIFVLIALYYAVQIAKTLFPYFVFIAVVSFIITIVLLFMDIEDIVKYTVGGICVVFIILSVITYVVGYGIEKTEVGKGLVESGKELDKALKIKEDAEKQAIDILKNTTIDVIDEIGEQSSDDVKPTLEITKKMVEMS